MKRAMLCALMMTLLLTGCAGRREAEDFNEWRDALSGFEEVCFSAEIIGDADGAEARFSVAVRSTAEETFVTVTAPDTISGIAYHSGETGERLVYDGVVLDLVPGRQDAESPCAGPVILVDALRRGSLQFTGTRGELLSAEILSPGGETVTLLRTGENIPVYAEIARGGVTTLTMRLSDWTEGEKHG